MLVEPTAEGMSVGVINLLANPAWRDRLAEAAGRYAEQHYSVGSYLRKVENIYRQVEPAPSSAAMNIGRPVLGQPYVEMPVDET